MVQRNKMDKVSLKLNTDYIVFGKPSLYKGLFNIPHPEIDVIEDKKEFTSGLQPVYHSTELLKCKRFKRESNC